MEHTTFCQQIEKTEGFVSHKHKDSFIIIVKLDKEIKDEKTSELWEEYYKVVGDSGRLIFSTPKYEIHNKK